MSSSLFSPFSYPFLHPQHFIISNKHTVTYIAHPGSPAPSVLFSSLFAILPEQSGVIITHYSTITCSVLLLILHPFIKLFTFVYSCSCSCNNDHVSFLTHFLCSHIYVSPLSLSCSSWDCIVHTWFCFGKCMIFSFLSGFCVRLM